MPELTRADISRVISKLSLTQETLRRNAYATMSAFWNWTADDYEDATNLPLAEVSPFQSRRKAPEKPDPRDRKLSDDEIAIVWRAASTLPRPFDAFFHLLIVTIQRRSEVAGIDWQELNRDDREWALPAERSKNGVANIVHLGELAVEALDRQAGGKKWPKQGLAITTNGVTPIGGFSYAKRLLDAAIAEIAEKAESPLPSPWIIHDLRRTGATKLQKLGIRLEVAEAVLNHRGKSKSGIVGVYQQYDFVPEKVLALDALDAEIQRILKLKDFTNVSPIRRNMAS